jgi:hypothetical protein
MMMIRDQLARAVRICHPSPWQFFRSRDKAGEGIRTLDMQLGKLPLCQLSYTRRSRDFRLFELESQEARLNE